MAHRQGGHRSKTLVFPSNWTSKWLYRAIINTPKWQTNAVLNSYKFGQWIAFESSALNGLRLPERISPEFNFVRSIVVGVKVSQAGKEYENMMNKESLEQMVENLQNLTTMPVVGDMIRNMTEANLPMVTPTEPVSSEKVVIPAPKPKPEEKEEEVIIA